MRRFVGRKRILLAWIISLGILALLAWKAEVRLDAIGDRFQEANWKLLVATLVGSVLWHMFVGADKWWRILRAQGAPVKFWEVFAVRLGSDPIRFATPFKAGEIVNAAYFGKIESFGFSRAAGSIAFDKALNFFGTVFWLYVGVVAMARIPTAGLLTLHTAVAVGVLALVCVGPVRRLLIAAAGAFHPKLQRFASGVLSAFEEFSLGKKVGFLLYGIVFQLRPLVVCGLLFAAFSHGRVPSVQEFLAYGSVVVLMSNVPLTVGGLGPREATLLALFSGYADEATLYLIGLTMSLAIHVLPAILGIPLMIPLLRSVTSRDESPRLVGAGPPAASPAPQEEGGAAGRQELAGARAATEDAPSERAEEEPVALPETAGGPPVE